jgi:hypothetical protein
MEAFLLFIKDVVFLEKTLGHIKRNIRFRNIFRYKKIIIMEIKYLKKMLKNPILRNWTNQGMLLHEIEVLESKYNNGIPFPQSFREFLYIAGKQSNLGDIDTGSGYEWMQEKARLELQECGKLIERPFFVISQLDSCTQFGFIYLDENAQDPLKYNCFADESYWDDYNFIEKSPNGTFSNFINTCVNNSIVEDDVLFKK